MSHNAENDAACPPTCLNRLAGSCVVHRPAENDVTLLWLCEAQDGVFLRPDTLYRFEVKAGCARCEELGARYGHRPIAPGHICPECREPVTREQPCWIEPGTKQRHHDPCPIPPARCQTCGGAVEDRAGELVCISGSYLPHPAIHPVPPTATGEGGE